MKLVWQADPTDPSGGRWVDADSPAFSTGLFQSQPQSTTRSPLRAAAAKSVGPTSETPSSGADTRTEASTAPAAATTGPAATSAALTQEMKTGSLSMLDTQLAGYVLAQRRGSSGLPAASGATSAANAGGGVGGVGAIVAGQAVTIDFTAADGNGAALLAQLQALGMTGGSSFGSVASGTLSADKIAALPGVADLGFARVSAMGTSVTTAGQGSVVTQADKAQRNDVARATYGVNGQGIKIGILSDSFNTSTSADTMATDVASGDLPADTTILKDEPKGTDEGRGMAQLVHDLAPNASIAFATAYGGLAAFANAIIALANAGAKIIVDDVYYVDESAYQDSVVAQAIDKVASMGVTYFSSAGNHAFKGYEAPFNAGATPITFSYNNVTYTAHQFAPGQDLIPFKFGSGEYINLQWDQPAASADGNTKGATSDLDLFVVNASGVVYTYSDGTPIASTSNNIGNDPDETIGISGGSTSTQRYILVGLRSGSVAPTDLKLTVLDNDSGATLGNSFASNTNDGTNYGHSAAVGAIAVGAAAYNNTPAYGTTPPVLENFSSGGPAIIWYDTAGNRLATPQVRETPVITAVDGGATTFFAASSHNFYGTSAAAPDAAATAALMLQANGDLTPTDIRNLLMDSAIDMDNPDTSEFDTGYDNGTGAGLIQADLAVGYASTLTFAADATHTVMTGTHLADTFTVATSGHTLAGGGGADLFVGTGANLDGTTITDFSAGDRIRITDASLGTFNYTYIAATGALTLSTGTQPAKVLTLPTGLTGVFVVSAASGGGVDLGFSAIPATWTAGTGSWQTAGNWQEPDASGHYVPGPTNGVQLANTLNGAAETVTFSGTAGTVYSLSGAAAVTLVVTGGLLTSTTGGSLDGLTLATGATFTVSGGTESLRNATLAGTVAGQGTLALLGGTAAFNAGLALNVATVELGAGAGGTAATATLNTDLTYGGALQIDAPTGAQPVLALGGHMLTLSGVASELAGGIVKGSGTLNVTGAAGLGTVVLGAGAVLQNSGAITQTGTVQIGDTGTAITRIANRTGSVYDLAGDVGITVGTNTASNFNNNGGTLAKTFGTGISAIAASFQNGSAAAAQINIYNGTLNFTGASNSFVNQAISGAGTFAIGGGGTSTISGGTTITTAGWTIGKVGTTVNLGQNLTYAGNFSDTNQTVLNLGANTLTLSGAATFNLGVVGSPIIAGTGKLITSGTDTLGAFTLGGSVLFRSNGTVNQIGTITLGDSSNGAAQFTNAPGKTWSIQGDYSIVAGNSAAVFNNGGATLTKASGTGTSVIGTNVTNLAGTAATISIASGILNFTGASNNFVADTISGAGTFAIGGGGVSTIGAGTSITTAGWTIAKVGTTVTLGTSLTYAGTFGDTNATTLNLGANTLTLSGPGTFAVGPAGSPVVTGSGKLIANGATTLGGLLVGGTALFRNNGTVTQSGTVQVGDSSGQVSLVTNGLGATWTIAGGANITQGATTATMFNNGGGHVIKTGTGTSTMATCLENLSTTTGTFEVAGGTLILGGTVTGKQAFTIDAASTLALNDSSTSDSTYAFAGAGATLQLNDAQQFGGVLTGFSAGENLDLRSILFGSGPTPSVSYNGTASSGTLTVADSARTATIAFTGNYSQSAFHLASDSHGGSLITYG